MLGHRTDWWGCETAFCLTERIDIGANRLSTHLGELLRVGVATCFLGFHLYRCDAFEDIKGS
jgi:hypothetical protein